MHSCAHSFANNAATIVQDEGGIKVGLFGNTQQLNVRTYVVITPRLDLDTYLNGECTRSRQQQASAGSSR